LLQSIKVGSKFDEISIIEVTFEQPQQSSSHDENSSTKVLIIVLSTVLGILLVAGVVIFFCCRRKRQAELEKIKAKLDIENPEKYSSPSSD
jgi:hypothetical protein